MALTKITKKPSDSVSTNKEEKKDERSESILYVEDDDTNWELTRIALDRKYQIYRATTDKETFERLGERDYSIILMDIQLADSDLDGIELTRCLRQLGDSMPPEDVTLDGTPIIFVTAYGGQYSKNDLLEAGGDDLITKPVDFTRLSLAITRLIARSISKEPKSANDASTNTKRKTRRENIGFRCNLRIGNYIAPAETLDVSGGGFKAVITDPLAAELLTTDPEIQVEAHLVPIFGGIEKKARVQRICEESPLTVAFEFEELTNDEKALLHHWLYGDKA